MNVQVYERTGIGTHGRLQHTAMDGNTMFSVRLPVEGVLRSPLTLLMPKD